MSSRIPLDHPLLTWLVAHTAYVRTVRVVGPDGATAQQRDRGNPNFPVLLTFGELCRYKTRSKEGGIGASSWRWGAGIWLGVDRRTGQYIVYDHSHGGIRHARTIKAIPSPQQWSLDTVQQVCVTPWASHEPAAPVIVPRDAHPEVPAQERQPHRARQLYIRQQDLDDHGYTDECPRCDAIRKYGPRQATQPHTDACRKRLEAAIAATPEGRKRIEAAQLRINRHNAEQVEEHADPPPAASQGEYEAAPEIGRQQDGDGDGDGGPPEPQDPPTDLPHASEQEPQKEEMHDTPADASEDMDVELVEDNSPPSLGCHRERDPGLEYILNLGEVDRRKEALQRHREIIELAYALGTNGKSIGESMLACSRRQCPKSTQFLASVTLLAASHA